MKQKGKLFKIVELESDASGAIRSAYAKNVTWYQGELFSIFQSSFITSSIIQG